MTRSSQPRRDVEAWPRNGPAHDGNGPTAVYCDFENLVLGAGSGPAGQTNPVPTKAVDVAVPLVWQRLDPTRLRRLG